MYRRGHLPYAAFFEPPHLTTILAMRAHHDSDSAKNSFSFGSTLW